MMSKKITAIVLMTIALLALLSPAGEVLAAGETFSIFVGASQSERAQLSICGSTAAIILRGQRVCEGNIFSFRGVEIFQCAAVLDQSLTVVVTFIFDRAALEWTATLVKIRPTGTSTQEVDGGLGPL